MTTLTLLANADVFAPAPLGRRQLLVGGGELLWIGDENPRLPDAIDVERLDLSGCVLCPGLIDCHVHLTGGGGEDGFASRVPPLALGELTESGVTTAVGMLGTDDVTRDTASLLAAIQGLVARGFNAYGLTGGYHLPARTLTGSIRTDIVFIDRLIGLGELAISDRRSSQPTLEELERAASEAYLAGLLAGKAGLVHLHVGAGPRGLALVREALARSELPPCVFHPTHVNRRRSVFEEALELVGRGCVIDVTAYPAAPGDEGLAAGAALRAYLDGGLPADRITVSSDAGGSMPRFDDDGRVVGMGVGSPRALLATLTELLGAGEPLARVLPAFTSNVASVLRLSGKGRIAVGADADLIALDRDLRLRHVMIGGRWHVRDGRRLVRGVFEEEPAPPRS